MSALPPQSGHSLIIQGWQNSGANNAGCEPPQPSTMSDYFLSWTIINVFTISSHSSPSLDLQIGFPASRYQYAALLLSPSTRCRWAWTQQPVGLLSDWARWWAASQSPLAWCQSACSAADISGGGESLPSDVLNSWCFILCGILGDGTGKRKVENEENSLSLICFNISLIVSNYSLFLRKNSLLII